MKRCDVYQPLHCILTKSQITWVKKKIERLTPSLLGHWWVSLPGQVVCCNRQPCEDPRFNRIWSWIDICISFQIQPCMHIEVPPARQGRPSSFWQIQNLQEVVPHCPELAEVTRSTWILYDIPMLILRIIPSERKNIEIFWDQWTSDTNTFMLSQIKYVQHVLHRLELLFLLIKNSHHLRTSSKSQIASCIRVVRNCVILLVSKFALQDFICGWFHFNSTYTTAFGLCKLLLSSSKGLHNCHSCTNPTSRAQTNRTKHPKCICAYLLCKFGEQTRTLSTGGPFESLQALDQVCRLPGVSCLSKAGNCPPPFWGQQLLQQRRKRSLLWPRVTRS